MIRQITSCHISVTKAQLAVPTAYSSMVSMSTRLRPNRSLIGPKITPPAAQPSNKSDLRMPFQYGSAVFASGLPIGRSEPVRIPERLHRTPDPASKRAAALREWRVTAARAASLLPDQICSDDDLLAIATTPPASAEELTSLTTFGPIAAARLFPPIRKALDTAADTTL